MCDGRVKLKSFELKAEPFENDGEGHEQFLAGKYDTGEFSLANYCALKSRGKPYMAIPAFPNRKFRHSYIFVPENSPLKEPAQLKGKKVGIPGWLNTCGLWVRGILSDEYGVKANDIHWMMPRPNKVELSLARRDASRRRAERALACGAHAPGRIRRDHRAGFSGGKRLAPAVGRLQSPSSRNLSAVRGIFPTSHAITFHSSYLEKHPSAAQEMFDACVEAKNLALRDDADATYSNFAWNRQMWEEQQAVLGPDPWRFGIKGNEKPLDALIRYADEQGLLAKKVTIADLFVQIDEPS